MDELDLNKKFNKVLLINARLKNLRDTEKDLEWNLQYEILEYRKEELGEKLGKVLAAIAECYIELDELLK